MTALHGFLGLPSDWAEIPLTASARKPAWMGIVPDLPDSDALPALAARLNRLLNGPDVLLGYSMGGRIALHMLVDEAAPRLWERAIIVSAAPGLPIAERESRIASDAKWANRFKTEPWETVVADWNAQAVFATEGTMPVARPEASFSREALAQTLVKGSVAKQDDLRESLKALQIPILWLAGERDAKYAQLAQECAALNPRFTCQLIPEAGHRLPWTAPDVFSQAVTTFLAG